MEPKYSHVILTTLLGLGLILTGQAVPSSEMTMVLVAFGVGVSVFAVVIVVWIGKAEVRKTYETATNFAEKLAALDPDQYRALGIRFPMLRIEYRGQPITTVEDSGVTLKHFRAFLDDSDFRQVSPERNWASREKPRSVWRKIMAWLQENDFIYPNSAAGSHSWLWKGESRKLLQIRYVYPHIQISRLHGDYETLADNSEPIPADGLAVDVSAVAEM